MSLWVHDRQHRQHPLAPELAHAIEADFGGRIHQLDGASQPGLRNLYRDRQWLQCGCLPPELAPIWILATRAHRVYLRLHTSREHAAGCPFSHAQRAAVVPQPAATTRSEVRLRRWQGPARVLFPRHLDDSADAERIGEGRVVRRAQLLQRLLRELLVRAGLDALPMATLTLRDGEPFDARALERLLQPPATALGMRVADRRDLPNGRGLTLPLTGPEPRHQLVVFPVAAISPPSSADERRWLFVRDPALATATLATQVAPGFDAATAHPDGPWLAMGVVADRDGPQLTDTQLIPLLGPHAPLPIDHPADRSPLMAALVAARAATRSGITGLALTARLFDDPICQAANRDGVYAITCDGMPLLYLSRHPGPSTWIDLTQDARAITGRLIAALKRHRDRPTTPPDHYPAHSHA